MNYDIDKVYIGNVAFPYTPIIEAGQHDVDLDSYTNTAGKTIRNRKRHDVKTLDFNIQVMVGTEIRDLLMLRDAEWFYVHFFDESEWKVIERKMYCSDVKYNKYYIDKSNANLNIYTDISFGFVEE